MGLSAAFSLGCKGNNGTLKEETKQVLLVWEILQTIVDTQMNLKETTGVEVILKKNTKTHTLSSL